MNRGKDPRFESNHWEILFGYIDCCEKKKIKKNEAVYGSIF